MELSKFTGLTNTVAPESIPDGGLVLASNIDIDDAGHIRRRRGMSQISSGSFHSLFEADDGTLFVVRDGDLCRLDHNLSTIVIRAGVGSEKLHYVQVGSTVYAKSSSVALRFGMSGDAEDWGIPNVPVFYASQTAGILPPGKYRVAVGYVRATDGLEGGVIDIREIELTSQGGIAISGIPSLPGYTSNVYLSTCDGEALYLAANGVTASTAISMPLSGLGIPLRTIGKYPPTGRGPLAQSAGSILIADGHVLWATDPYQYEQVEMATNYKLMESRITFSASLGGGVFLGTESAVYFMEGPFASATLRKVSSHGAPDQTPNEIDLAFVLDGSEKGIGVLFSTNGGVCVGLASGDVINLTNRQFEFPKASEVALMYRKQDGLNQFVGVSSHPGTPTGSARFGDFVDAEIIRHKET